MNTIKYGSRGEDVEFLQRQLHLYVDGIFGKMTDEAVKQYQFEHNLKVDGIVGPETWSRIIYLKKSNRKVDELIIHCTATPEGKDYTVDNIREWHKKRGFSDIGYHYIIYRDGTLHNGRDADISGAHCLGHNSHSIGICYVGGLARDGKTPKDTRTFEQKKALNFLVKKLLIKYDLYIEDVKMHNQYANKVCPSFSYNDFKIDYYTKL